MDTIYVLTRNFDYEGAEVVGAFTSLAAAQRHAAAIYADKHPDLGWDATTPDAIYHPRRVACSNVFRSQWMEVLAMPLDPSPEAH